MGDTPVPEANIGLVGHVDHGKCLAVDEPVLINNEIVSGEELVERAKSGEKIGEVSAGELYSVEGLHTYTLTEEGTVERIKADVYVEDYSGELIRIRTEGGREITLTKSHPLLKNTSGELAWKPSTEVQVGDYIAVAQNLPLETDHVEIEDQWRRKLRDRYEIIDSGRVKEMAEKTEGFTSFETFPQIDFVRRFLGESKTSFAEQAGISADSYFRASLGETEMSARNLEKLLRFTKTLDIDCGNREIVLVPKSEKDYRQARFNDLPVDEDFVRFTAFLLAEGRLTSKRVELCQRDHPEMRDTVISYLERNNLEVHQISDKDFRIDSKGFVDYLRAKFDLGVGDSRSTDIPGWIHSLPLNLKAEFLRWFFTFEADINPHAGQITLTQANRNTINRISYLLQESSIKASLGKIRAKATNSPHPRERTYHSLTISGSRNLKRFSREIGLEAEEKQEKLRAAIKEGGKPSNRSIPVDAETLDRAISILRAKPSNTGAKQRLKERDWYKGFEDARQKGRLTHGMFDKIQDSVRREAENIRAVETTEDMKELMDLAGVTAEDIANEIGASTTQTERFINREKGARKQEEAFKACHQLAGEKIEKSTEALRQLEQLFEGPITFERVEKKEVVQYDGEIVDLTVPETHNFFAGHGGILCHNTTLTNALSGEWTDTHSEELRRGITIRLGYADITVRYCSSCDRYTVNEECEECGEESDIRRSVSLVDAPGHETLMANVLSGAAIMDGAMLLVAANEEVPQPQTREHLAALERVGIENIVIVQNKIDLVEEEDARENYSQIKDFVEGTVAEEAPVIPVSAQHRTNIDLLLEAVEENIPTPDRDSDAEPKMLVARSFDINRPGTPPGELRGGVVGGSLQRGDLEVGDEISLQPGYERDGSWEPVETEVRSIIHGDSSVEKARPGGLLGIETGLDPSLTKSDNLAGNVLGLKGKLPEVREELEIEVDLMEAVVGSEEEQEVEPIKEGEPLLLNVGTGKTSGPVTEAGSTIKVGLKRPVCADKGDTVAVSRRMGSRWRLIGAGTIL